ncbi:MAG TPA: DUF4349 domain-containing protein [Ktedonobacteraceae bacterium]|nr:DUF4349 domain-containing protein [Ktedonobacteraceae bacterium]
MEQAKKHFRCSVLLCGGLVMLALLLVACGASSASTTGSASMAKMPASSMHAPANYSTLQGSNTNASGQSTGNSSNASSTSYSPRYLIKALQVDMAVKDTVKAASDLQSWIQTTDPRSTSEGLNYQQDPNNNNLYDITLTFAVEAADYPRVESYLSGYAAQHQGRLLDLHETVQDVTTNYIDTQSQLKNLRAEQQRLLTLMGQAQSLNDILTVEQKLTDVEGQIEQIEENLNALNGQITYYNVTINLHPTDVATPAPVPTQPGWNPGSVFHGALSVALAIGEALISLIIWLAVFSIYIVPAAILAWFGFRLKRDHDRRAVPVPVAVPSTHPKDTSGVE